MASNASLAKQNYVTITMLFALNAFDDELFKLVGIMLRARVKQQHHEGTNWYCRKLEIIHRKLIKMKGISGKYVNTSP